MSSFCRGECWLCCNGTERHVHHHHSDIRSDCRLYETQVKKIVKVQSMMRAFLAKRNVAHKLIKFRQDSGG